MNKGVKIFLFIIGTVLTLVSLLCIAICVSISNEFPGDALSGETYGMYSIVRLFAVLASIAASVPWIILYVNYWKNKVEIKQ